MCGRRTYLKDEDGLPLCRHTKRGKGNFFFFFLSHGWNYARGWSRAVIFSVRDCQQLSETKNKGSRRGKCPLRHKKKEIEN